MGMINALSTEFPGIVDCIKTDATVTDPYSGKCIKTLAIWDTGATNSVITRRVASNLGLVPVGRAVATGVHGSKVVPVYAVRITLHNENITMTTQVTECEELSAEGDTGMLIGMNIIKEGDFCISNYNGRTKMTFRVPSLAKTDYVEELELYKRCRLVHERNVQHHNHSDKCACGSGKQYKNCHGKYLPDG